MKKWQKEYTIPTAWHFMLNGFVTDILSLTGQKKYTIPDGMAFYDEWFFYRYLVLNGTLIPEMPGDVECRKGQSRRD